VRPAKQHAYGCDKARAKQFAHRMLDLMKRRCVYRHRRHASSVPSFSRALLTAILEAPWHHPYLALLAATPRFLQPRLERFRGATLLTNVWT
jgi:hypothetical protein